MNSALIRLYPPDGAERSLDELPLAERLVQLGSAADPFLYSSFIMSLNGAIAVAGGDGEWTHPPTLFDPRDLRLLCGLMAQADCLITNSGYLRDLDRGRLGNLLQLPEHPDYRALRDYRARNHPTPAPAVLAVSRSLDFPLPEPPADGQRLVVLTGQASPEARRRELRGRGVEVRVCGDPDWVGAAAVREALGELGARTAYLFCGPRLNGVLLRAGLLRRVYLSWRHLLHGGDPALTAGAGLPADFAAELRLEEMHQAPPQDGLPGLWFARFAPAARPS